MLATAHELATLHLGPAPTTNELEKLAVVAAGKQPNTETRWAARLLAEAKAGKTFARTYPYPVQVWQLGGKQLWITLGGEVVVDYALRFKQTFGPQTWVAGYVNDVMGYIPTERVLREGGYEGLGATRLGSLHPGPWAPGLEEQIIAKVHELERALALGR